MFGRQTEEPLANFVVFRGKDFTFWFARILTHLPRGHCDSKRFRECCAPQAESDEPPRCLDLAWTQVKVAFGKVWKETLTELSGGQRSLLALSLILSLLLFKPGEQSMPHPLLYRAQ